ncbi:MAG: GntR family transcriptional regulator [Spirulina sp.]
MANPLQFNIQTDSDIPASKQLFDQIQFAIASRQYPPGHRLPSTRQLAQITGLHRNTVSKVYRQLEETGLVESQAGSGIYVKAQGHEGGTKLGSPILKQHPEVDRIVRESIDELLIQGFTLSQARELFLAEIDWRLRCSAIVLVTVPQRDLGAGELMVKELEGALKIPIQLVALEELASLLEQTHSGTVVTSRYFIKEAEAIAAPKSVRVIPVDIYDYERELAKVKDLRQNSCLGLVSLSDGILGIAQILVHSLRGGDLLVMTARVDDTYRLNALIRSAHTIICDRASYAATKQAILDAREDLIRHPDLICSENYIGEKSINLLKRELGLG